jgi:hypothetical protein
MAAEPEMVAAAENPIVPDAPPDEDHCPLTEAPVCESVIATVSVTVAPALTKVQVPVHAPARESEGVDGPVGVDSEQALPLSPSAADIRRRKTSLRIIC